jgi:hypothetical protein
MNQSRRAFLIAASGGLSLLAGCVDTLGGGDEDARESALSGVDEETATATPRNETAASQETTENQEQTATEDTPEGETATEADVPVREPTVSLDYELSGLEEDALNGGVGKDGIPSIDDPTFEGVGYGDEHLDPQDPVFGVNRNGVAKAYPQYILVSHEIVNDTIDGDGVAVTYCPLTGSALGFERGDAEFGVSGMLVNSNLIMYDRPTDSWWPQIHPVSPLGELGGWALDEFRVTWTTWERWKAAHADTRVLTEDTGAARNYASDPYGSYNPRGGYYDDSNVLFQPRYNNGDYHPKDVFIGARSADGALGILKDTLREDHIQTATLDGTQYVAVYHDQLDSAWVYRNPDEVSFEETDTGYEAPDESVYDADKLPLEAVNAFDVFWFAWYGFYPDTEIVA